MKLIPIAIVSVLVVSGAFAYRHFARAAAEGRCPFGFDRQAAACETAPVATPGLKQPGEELTLVVFDLARNGVAEGVREYLAAGYEPNASNARGDTLLTVAAYNGRAEVVDALLATSATRVDLQNRMGFTALTAAAMKGEVAIARALLDAGAAIEGENTGGRTPLMFAAMFGRADAVELLLERGADPRARDAEGRDAAGLARDQGADAIARRIDGAGAVASAR